MCHRRTMIGVRAFWAVCMMVNLLTHGEKMMQMQQKTHELRRRKRSSPSHTKHLEYIPVKSFFHLTESCCMCESQHLQAQRIQRLNSKFILVRIRNTDHVLRVRWDQNPLTEIWQWWCVIGRGGGIMSGRNGVLQCSVNKIGGEWLLSTAESSTDHSSG